MGKIIRNGIKYSGTTNSADKINYNNTLSGLEAETAQEAFDELNTKIKNGGNIEYLTQEEYDALPDTKLFNNVEYRITNANESVNAARDWAYDNAASGLEAENVQDAIDEVNDKIGEDENGMTIHEKLDILMGSGEASTSGSLITLSNTTGTNLSVEIGDLILISYYHWEATVSNATLVNYTSGTNETIIRIYRADSTSVTINSQSKLCMYAVLRGVEI